MARLVSGAAGEEAKGVEPTGNAGLARMRARRRPGWDFACCGYRESITKATA